MTPDSVMPGGTLLGNRYRLVTPLGTGGFATVYLAQDTNLYNKEVVIKTLLECQQSSTWADKKFKQECEALARIDHPGVVRVLDRVAGPDGRNILVMALIEGDTLRTLIERSPEGMDLRSTATVLRQIGHALDAAHDAGVQHRDLKPMNIMIRGPDFPALFPVLIDFGIANVVDSEVGDDTASRVAGTLTYMAPEHLDGKPEPASDIYALGVVAFEMVTGSVPFKARSQVDLYRQQAQGPPDPCKLRPDLPEAARAVILKALAFHPAGRYARAADFGAEFDAAVSEPPAPQRSTGISWRLMAMIEAGLFLALLAFFLLKR